MIDWTYTDGAPRDRQITHHWIEMRMVDWAVAVTELGYGSPSLVRSIGRFRWRKPDNDPSRWVYFARSRTTGTLKVGLSCSPEHRVRRLSCYSEKNFELLACLPSCSEWHEQQFHHLLFPYKKLSGWEWFVDCPPIRIFTWHVLELLRDCQRNLHEPRLLAFGNSSAA